VLPYQAKICNEQQPGTIWGGRVGGGRGGGRLASYSSNLKVAQELYVHPSASS